MTLSVEASRKFQKFQNGILKIILKKKKNEDQQQLSKKVIN